MKLTITTENGRPSWLTTAGHALIAGAGLVYTEITTGTVPSTAAAATAVTFFMGVSYGHLLAGRSQGSVSASSTDVS